MTGLALGYLHGWLKLDTFLPSDGKLQRWERPPALLFGRRLFGGRWVRVDEATGHLGGAWVCLVLAEPPLLAGF